MEFQGKVLVVSPVQSGVSARGTEWQKLDFVVEQMNVQYPKKAAFTLMGADRIKNNPVTVGMEVQVSFDIDAHEYNGKWFNSVNAWQIQQVVNGQVINNRPQTAQVGQGWQPQPQGYPQPQSMPMPVQPVQGAEGGELPF